MKKVICIWSKQEVTVDETKRKLMSYDNEKRQAVYNAPIIENCETTRFYTDYVENDVVITDVDERLRAHGSGILVQYGLIVGCDSLKHDPDGKIWSEVVAYATEHPDEFFDKYGNLKSRITIADVERICGIR